MSKAREYLDSINDPIFREVAEARPEEYNQLVADLEDEIDEFDDLDLQAIKACIEGPNVKVTLENGMTMSIPQVMTFPALFDIKRRELANRS